MKFKSLPALIQKLERRAIGLDMHLTELTDVGVLPTDAEECRALALQLAKLEAERESLKTALAEKTAELQEAQAAGDALRKRVTKQIRKGLRKRKELWADFGLESKK
jgi:predicted RNase H-like nuclease (RuvC/YqgF family)